MANGYISKIKLPSGNTYIIKDEEARQLIAGGVTFNVAWDGSAAPVIANIPAGVTVKYGNQTYTGTLATTAATPGAFYLVKSSTSTTEDSQDVYDEYVVIKPDINDATTWFWEKIGDTKVDLTEVVKNVTFQKGTGDNVLGEGTTFTSTPANTSAYIKAAASGANTAWNNKDSKTVVTGYSNTTSDTFVKSVSAETNKKLVTTSITPTNGTTCVSKVTKSVNKLVTTTIPNVTGNTSVSIPNVTGNTQVSVPNITGNDEVTIPNVTANSAPVTANRSTWGFQMCTSSGNEETLYISGSNGSDVTATNTTLGTALKATKTVLGACNIATNTVLGSNLTATNTTLGTAITAATGALSSTGTGGDVTSTISITNCAVAKAGTAVTVATGATAANGSGDAIVTGVTIGDSASAITALGSPSTATVVGTSSTFTVTQPTVALQNCGSTSGTGKVEVLTGACTIVTANNNDVVKVAKYADLSVTTTKYNQ